MSSPGPGATTAVGSDRALPAGVVRHGVAAGVLGGCVMLSLLMVAVRVTGLGGLSFRWAGLAGVSAPVAVAGALVAAAAGVVAFAVGPGPARALRPVWLVALASVWGVAGWTVGSALLGVAAPERAATGSGFTVATQNLWYLHPDPATAAPLVLRTDADVLVLVEYTPAHAAALDEAGAGRYPHRWTDAGELGDGLAIFSRYPLDDVRVLATTAPAVDAELGLPSGPVRLVAWHPRAPREPWGLIEWQADYARLTRHLAGAPGDLIIVGDFNATDAHEPLRRLAAAAGVRDAATVSGAGLSGTWPADGTLPPLMRLDRVMVGDGVGVEDVETTARIGSDHLGVVARLRHPRS